MEDSKSVPLWSPVPLWYHHKLTPLIHMKTFDNQGVVFLVLDGSSFCVSRTKNGEEKCECESK